MKHWLRHLIGQCLRSSTTTTATTVTTTTSTTTFERKRRHGWVSATAGRTTLLGSPTLKYYQLASLGSLGTSSSRL